MRDGGFLLHPTLSTCLSWSFVSTWFCTLNWVTEMLMRAVSNVHAGRRFLTPALCLLVSLSPRPNFTRSWKKSGADLESQFSIFCNFPVRVLIDSNTKNSFGSISSVPTGNMLLLVVCSFVKPAAVIARSASHTCACCNAVLNQCCRSPMM